jgi:hypothetical protein
MAENDVGMFDVPTFCRRNSIGVSSAYRLAREGKLKISKVYGKALVTAEDEAEFRKAVTEGKLATPKKYGRHAHRAKLIAQPQADAEAA